MRYTTEQLLDIDREKVPRVDCGFMAVCCFMGGDHEGYEYFLFRATPRIRRGALAVLRAIYPRQKIEEYGV